MSHSACLFCMTMFLSAMVWVAKFIIFHKHVASCVSGGCRRGPCNVSEIGRCHDVEDFVCEMEDLETV